MLLVEAVVAAGYGGDAGAAGLYVSVLLLCARRVGVRRVSVSELAPRSGQERRGARQRNTRVGEQGHTFSSRYP